MSAVVKIHTAVEIAALLGKDYKTVLSLTKRGHLRALMQTRGCEQLWMDGNGQCDSVSVKCHTELN